MLMSSTVTMLLMVPMALMLPMLVDASDARC
jgi:hypothetical protein